MRKTISIAAIAGLIATVVGGLILSLMPTSINLLRGAGSWLWDSMLWVWAILGSSHTIPGWAILTIGLLALVGLVALGILLIASLQRDTEQTYRNYTEDMLDGLRWRWEWTGNKIDRLWCFCPSCDAQLVYSEAISSTLFICERCPSDGSLNRTGKRGRVVATIEGGDRQYAVAAAEREIIRRIRIGER